MESMDKDPNHAGRDHLGAGVLASGATCQQIDGLVRLTTMLTGMRCSGGMSMAKLDEYVTIKEAAEFLGVSPNTLRNWHRDGKIPVFRSPINNYRLFRKADLEELLRRIEESGTYPSGWKRSGWRSRKPR